MYIITAFWVSTIGDKLKSDDLKSNCVVNDLFLGKVVRCSFSLTSEQTILVDDNLLIWFNSTGSYPWSMNDVSDPLALVPDTVLILLVNEVLLPGVMKLNLGKIELYWTFCEAKIRLPPTDFWSVKHNKSSSLFGDPDSPLSSNPTLPFLKTSI